MSEELWLAPLRGVTVRSVRCAFAPALHDAGFSGVYAPFIPALPVMRIRPAMLNDIRPGPAEAADESLRLPLVPQVIGKDPEALRALLTAFKDIGYKRADLNAGCPFPMIIHKNRGSGLMRVPKILESMLAVGVETMGPGNFSLKIRLGVDDPRTLAKLMPMINSFPLAVLTIHARTAKQMYSGGVDLERFAEAAAISANPVMFNGDITSSADLTGLRARFPSVTRWMVGRGFVRSLAARKDATELLCKYMDLCEAELHGPSPVLGRMKELLSYWKDLDSFWQKKWEIIKLCHTLDELRRSVF